MNKFALAPRLLALPALLLALPAPAVDLSATGGLNTEYIFRGVPQSDGKAAGFGNIDIEQSGFYGGIWGSTVDAGEGGNDGLELDFYGGYGGEVGDFSYGVGLTLYRYTDDFDDDYDELNLTGGWSFLTLNVDIGEYDNFGDSQDYQHTLLTAEYKGLFAAWGAFYDDFDGNYYMAGYGNTLTVADTDLFDYSFSLIHSDDDLLGSSDTNIVVEISKSFSLFSN